MLLVVSYSNKDNVDHLLSSDLWLMISDPPDTELAGYQVPSVGISGITCSMDYSGDTLKVSLHLGPCSLS